jgi:hypothetical protein
LSLFFTDIIICIITTKIIFAQLSLNIEGFTKELHGHIKDYGVTRKAGMCTTTTKEIREMQYADCKE